MTSRQPILLLDGAARQPVPAELVEELTLEDIQRVDASWTPFLRQALRNARANGLTLNDLPEHSHWQWERKWHSAAAGSQFLSIECEGETQAMMSVRTDKTCRLPEQSGLPLIYVDYLAAAPWNLPGLMGQSRFRRGGLALLVAAVQLSRESGYNGRIGLHSLPKAESFYHDRCGMTDLGKDIFYEDLHYLEMTEAQSAAFTEGTEQWI